MEGQVISENTISNFRGYLRNEEKSQNTIEKYIRDVGAFLQYLGSAEVTKEMVIAYKNSLIAGEYAARSINSMLASLNCLFSFLGKTAG